jgi:hypothetical protein
MSTVSDREAIKRVCWLIALPGTVALIQLTIYSYVNIHGFSYHFYIRRIFAGRKVMESGIWRDDGTCLDWCSSLVMNVQHGRRIAYAAEANSWLISPSGQEIDPK